jgi:hypothetical protein
VVEEMTEKVNRYRAKQGQRFCLGVSIEAVDRGGRSGRSFEEGAKRGDKEETVGSSGREKESTKGWKVEMKCVIGSKAYFVSKP